MSLEELVQKIKKYRKEEINITPLMTEIHKRLSMAFASLVFVLTGLPLAIRTGRKESSINFTVSMGIAFVYWILLAFGEALSLRGFLNAAVALWLPNLLLASLGLFFTFRTFEGHP